MPKYDATRRSGRWLLGAAAMGGLAALAPSDAAAHFVLDEPAASLSQSGLGDPQKAPPCGDGAGGARTGTITAYQTGQTITVTVHETVFHPGHYRVALAVNDRSELPAEPLVTPGSTPCGTVAIMDPPVFPVLADGMLLHTTPLSGPQSFEVALPAGVTCDHCTLQVIEFMSNHPLNVPGGCFYHHCAELSIHDVVVADDAGVAADAGGTTPMDAGVDAGAPPRPTSGCACAVAQGRSTEGGLVYVSLALIPLIARRRRRALGTRRRAQMKIGGTFALTAAPANEMPLPLVGSVKVP
jgi:hypothetical protein